MPTCNLEKQIESTFSKKLSIEFIWFDNNKEMEIDYKKAFIDVKYKF